MADERVWTAEELERLSPDERHRVVNDGVITDLSKVPAEFLDRVRRKGRDLLEQRGLLDQQRGG
jgi:hypothetical protein